MGEALRNRGMVKNMRKEDAEAAKFLHLESTTDTVLEDPTVKGFREK